jgi:hypothetical protein
LPRRDYTLSKLGPNHSISGVTEVNRKINVDYSGDNPAFCQTPHILQRALDLLF